MKLSTFILRAAPWLIATAAVLLVLTLVQQSHTQYAVKETSAYTRVSNCILGKSAYQVIKQSDVEKCYQQVENSSGIRLQRFDYQTSSQPVNN